MKRRLAAYLLAVLMAWPITDTFTGTSGTTLASHTSDSGATWTAHPSYAGTAKLDGANRLENAGTGLTVYYASDSPPGADYEVSGSLLNIAGSGVHGMGVVARVATGTDSYVYGGYNLNLTRWEVLELNGGSIATLGTSSATITNGQSYALKLRVTGSTASLYVDGVLTVGPVTTAITVAGRAGVRMNDSSFAPDDTSFLHLDNFVAQDIPDPTAVTGGHPYFSTTAPAATRINAGVLDRSPVDAGLTPIPSTFTVSAPGPRRSTAAFTPPTPPPGDVGQFLVMPEFPDRAPGLPRYANYVRIVASMPDVGTSPIPGRFPDEYRPIPRRANTGSSWPSPLDQGNTPIPGRFPDVARGPSRSAASAYFWVNQRSYDNPVGVPGPIPANRPDIARAAPRFQAFTVQSPMDLGIDISPPLHQTFPDRAPAAPRFQAWTVHSPVDAGVIFPAPPILSSDPDFARAAPRYQAWHVRSPLEPVPPPPVAPMLPTYPEHRERKGRQATSQYFIGLRPPMEVATISYRIYANAGDGGPIDYDTPIDSTTSTTWTSPPLSPSSDYRFAVRAFDSGSGLEDKNLDASVQLKTDATSKDITRIPYAPLGLVAHNLKAS